jgi:hypothetical protein
VWRTAGALGKGHSAGSRLRSSGAAGNPTINDRVALPQWLELAEVRADTFLPER